MDKKQIANKFTNYISVAICLAFLVYIESSLRLLS